MSTSHVEKQTVHGDPDAFGKEHDYTINWVIWTLMKITLLILNKHNINARLYIKLKTEELVLLWHHKIIRQEKESEREMVTLKKNDIDLSSATAKSLLGWNSFLENINTSLNLPQHRAQVLQRTHTFDKLITNKTKYISMVDFYIFNKFRNRRAVTIP